MDYIISYIGSFTSDSGMSNVILTAVIGLTIFTFAISVMFLVAGATDPTRRRLKLLTAKNTKDKKTAFGDKMASSFKGLNPVILPQNQDEQSKIKLKLVQAGFRSQSAVFLFFAIKTLLAVLLPIIVIIVAPMFPMIKAEQVMMFAILFMGVGVFGPNIVVSKIFDERQLKIKKGFSDALDLLVVCVEAGLSIDMAFRRIAKEMKYAHPILAEEFVVVNGEINAGLDRTQALKNFAERTGVPEIKGFVALLSQSIKLGTSIADTLRIYSEDFRDKRMQAAEELAAKVGTKLIFPLVFCFFPSFFVIAIGPVIIRIIDIFGK